MAEFTGRVNRSKLIRGRPPPAPRGEITPTMERGGPVGLLRCRRPVCHRRSRTGPVRYAGADQHRALQPAARRSARRVAGHGHKFELIGSAADAQDPDNPTNDVISTQLDLVSNFFGGAIRRLPPGIKIAALDDQINLKYRFTSPRTCFGGSPRITLFIDANGDGKFEQAGVVAGGVDFAGQGHVNPPIFMACVQNVWRIEDLTDLLQRWETTPATVLVPPCGPVGGPTTCTWDDIEARVTAQYPNHRVFAGGLLDDTFGGPGQTGTAHYDLITVENRTLENRQDTVP